MNITLKIDSARKLKKYISTHPRIASNTGCEAILDQLYQAYADSQEHNPPEIERDFEQLGELLEILPLDINNTIFSLIFHLSTFFLFLVKKFRTYQAYFTPNPKLTPRHF